MSASAWNPSGSVVQITGITIKSQSFTAVAAQTLFTGANQYTPGLNQLEVTKNGVWLSPAQVVEDAGGFAFSIPACTAGDVVVARVFTPTTDAFQALATASQNSANAAATSAASSAAIFASIQGLTGTVIGSGNLTFAGVNQKILGDVGLNVTRDIVTTGTLVGGSATGFRNKIINGAMLVAQRGLVAIAQNQWNYGGCDRIACGPTGFTTFSGNLSQGLDSFGVGINAQLLSSVTTTGAGQLNYQTRIEAVIAKQLFNKLITVSMYYYHNTGAPVTVTAYIGKATAVDNFSSQAELANVSQVIQTNSRTKITFSFQLGTTDTQNGLYIGLRHPLGAVTGLAFYTDSWQLEEGSVATPFENRPYGLELALCQRYYQTRTSNIFGGYGTAGGAYYLDVSLPVQMRTVPTVALGTPTYNNCSALAVNTAFSDHIIYSAVVTTTGSGFCTFPATLSAEL